AFEKHWLSLVYRSGHRAGSNEYLCLRGIIPDNEDRVHGAIPAWLRANEVDEGDLELIGSSERSVVGLVRRSRPICIKEAVVEYRIVIWRVDGRVDGQSSRAPLHGGSEDSLRSCEERDAHSAVREAAIEAAEIRNVLAELRREHIEGEHAGGSQSFVALHLRDSSDLCRGNQEGRFRGPPREARSVEALGAARVRPAVAARVARAGADHPAAALRALDRVLPRVEQGGLAGRR